MKNDAKFNTAMESTLPRCLSQCCVFKNTVATIIMVGPTSHVSNLIGMHARMALAFCRECLYHDHSYFGCKRQQQDARGPWRPPTVHLTVPDPSLDLDSILLQQPTWGTHSKQSSLFGMHGVKVMMSVDEGTEDGSLSIMGLLRLSIILVFLLFGPTPRANHDPRLIIASTAILLRQEQSGQAASGGGRCFRIQQVTSSAWFRCIERPLCCAC